MAKPSMLHEALRITPARPNIPAGLRAALVTTLPLLLGPLIHRPGLAWTGLAGFSLVLVDKGGAYRTRAATMLALSITASLAVLLGTLAAAHTAIAMLLLLIVVGIGGYMRLFGAEATAVGTVTSVTLVVALARPVLDLHEALTSTGFFLVGSLWAALISLVLWPLRLYRPARYAVASALRQLANVASSLVAASVDASAQLARRAQLGAARAAIENARAALGTSRRSRPGPTRLGGQLVALLEASDQLFAALVALEDGLALEPPETLPKVPKWIDREAQLIDAELTTIAGAVETETALPERSESVSRAIANSIAPHALSSHEHILRILTRALERLDRVIDIAQTIDDPEARPVLSRSEPSDLSSRASKRSLLRDHWTLDSAVFRHALRTSLSTAVTLLLVHALQLEHGYWATLTCLVIMQPHGAATWTRALQRVLGTTLGAGLAMLIVSVVHQPLLITTFVFAFVAIGMALLPLNYGAYAVFLTPAFVLLAETHSAPGNLAVVRVVNTLLGAGIALLASRLLFPLSERDQFRPLMADALSALDALLQIAAARRPAPAALQEARRKIGMSLLNAEASYQRLLTESGVAPAESEALLTLLLYVHRLASGLIALAVAEGTTAHRELAERTVALSEALAELRTAIVQRRAPHAIAESRLPNTMLGAEGVVERSGERVDRLFDQLAVLRDATQRWNASPIAPK